MEDACAYTHGYLFMGQPIARRRNIGRRAVQMRVLGRRCGVLQLLLLTLTMTML